VVAPTHSRTVSSSARTNRPEAAVPQSMTPLLAARDTAGIAKRNLLRVLRTPQMLTIRPLSRL
jgi:hypothetical protein